MDNFRIKEDPVIKEIRAIRTEISEQTKGMTPDELSRWYREQARLVEERFYGKEKPGKTA